MTRGLSAATVFEVNGLPRAFVQGLELLRKAGILMVLGVYPEKISIDVTRVVVREIKIIRDVYGPSAPTWNRVLAFSTSG